MSSEKTLYLKGDRNVEVTKPEVTLGDILSLECSDKTIIPKVKAIRLLKIKENSRQQRFVISILEIIACIHEKYPSLEVQNLGEQDIIVTYEKQKTPGFPRVFQPFREKTLYRGPHTHGSADAPL